MDETPFTGRVRDAMTTAVRTIWPAATAKEAALFLREYRVSGLPVVGADGRVVGVVSESDLVRADASPSSRARATVADVMSAPALVVGPDAEIDVDVGGGWVRLRGEVPTRRQAEFVAREVARIPGVRTVVLDTYN
jgi:hypothetical protein